MYRKALNNAVEQFNGDFWKAVESLIDQGWRMNNFHNAGIEEIFNESFDNPVAENMDYLAGMMPGKEAGSAWMNYVLVNTDTPEEWYRLDYQEFLQAAANANRPPFPAFDTSEESDAAYDAAWDELQRCKQLDIQDKIYQEQLEKDLSHLEDA